MEVFQRRVVILIGDDPLLPVLGHTGDRQIASRLPREVVEISLIIRVQDPPRDALERTHGGNRPLGYGIEQKLGEIGTRIFRENPHRAASEVLRDNGGGVAAPAVEPINKSCIHPARPVSNAVRLSPYTLSPGDQHTAIRRQK
jgi:hypothetical protein